MLKTRIIPTLLHRGHGLVKGVGFDSWRRVGTAVPAIKVYCTREVDELILLDISATPEGRLIDYEEIDHLADECFMPLTVGGGVKSPDDCRCLLRAGADKVAMNTAAVEDPDLISASAAKYGSQCVVLSIDFKRLADGSYEVFTCCGTRATGLDPVTWAREGAERGAGEILLTSIDRDGSMSGYDVELTAKVADAVGVPLIASGGAGSYADMLDVLKHGRAAAVAAASIFHFTEQTPAGAKNYLAEHGVAVRL